MNVFLFPAALCLPVASLCLPAHAAPSPESGDRFELGVLEPVVVQGDGIDADQTSTHSTVTSDDMRRFNRTDVSQALELLPGVNTVMMGGRSERLINVRGFDSRQVPLFIDGIPVYVPYDGNIDLSRLTTYDVAEISVSKGYTSLLAGPNTLGGAINVVGRRPRLGTEAEAGYGMSFDDRFSRNAWDSYANVGTNQGLWYAQVGGSIRDQDYFPLAGDFDPTPDEDGGRRENSEYTDRKLSLRLGFTPNASDEYVFSYYKQDGEKQTPPYAGDDPNTRVRFWQWPWYDKESFYFNSKTRLHEHLEARLRLYYDSFENSLRSYDDATYSTMNRPYAFDSTYDDYSWGGSVELGTDLFERHDLRLAVHYKTDVHREVGDIGEPEQRFEDRTVSVGVEDRFAATDRLTLLAGISYDRLRGEQADNLVNGTIEPFELASTSAVNLQAGALFAFNDHLKGRLIASKRSRYPTIKDRYSFRMGSALPNPDLDAETSTGVEAGLAGDLLVGTNTPMHWGAAVFRNEIDDSIQSIAIDNGLCSSPPCSQLQNVAESVLQGAEAELTVNLGNAWQYHLNYTYLHRDNKSDPDLRALDTPRHSGFTYLSWFPGDTWTLTASARADSGRYNDSDGTRQTAGFVTTGLKAAWRPLPQWQLEAGVDNLGDKLYAYDEGYYEPGRTYFTKVRWRY